MRAGFAHLTKPGRRRPVGFRRQHCKWASFVPASRDIRFAAFRTTKLESTPLADAAGCYWCAKEVRAISPLKGFGEFSTSFYSAYKPCQGLRRKLTAHSCPLIFDCDRSAKAMAGVLSSGLTGVRVAGGARGIVLGFHRSLSWPTQLAQSH